MQPFTQQVVMIIQGIPEGRVMTYGQIAALAGSHRGARQVVRILHTLSQKHQLPWHRVLNAKGEIGFKDSEAVAYQRALLEAEGVKFCKDDRLDLEKYLYHPNWQMG